MSLSEVTPDKAAKRQRATASPAALGMCDRIGWKDLQGWCVGVWRSFHDLRDGVVEGWVTSWRELSVKPLVGDLDFQDPSGVHLHMGLETLFRGPVLRLFPMAGWVVRDGVKLREGKARGRRCLREGKGERGLERLRDEGGGRGVVVATRSFGTDGLAISIRICF